MIVVTRLNDSQFAVNPDLIERIHATPDTTLVMVDGARYIVTETMPEVIQMIAQFRAHVISLARDMPVSISSYSGQLGLVAEPEEAEGPVAVKESPAPLRLRKK